MAKIELGTEELQELLVSMKESAETLAGLMTSIQTNFRHLKDAPGIDAQAAVQASWRQYHCLERILTKERYSIEDL